MNNSNLLLAMIRQRANDVDRRAQMLGPLLAGLADESAPVAPEPLTVRLGRAADWPALSRVAELDSASLPAPPLLVGERDGRLIAALSLSNGAVVANPFLPTADVVALLELRARQLRREGRRRPGRAIAWRLSRAGN
jgi:hypothetical protein